MSALSYQRSEDAWKGTRKTIDEAVSMDPDRSLTVRLLLKRTVADD